MTYANFWGEKVSIKYVMLTAGGTGGHLFPAYALSEELLRRGYVVDLITDLRGERYGGDFPARKILKVPAATFSSKSPIAILKTLYKLTAGTIKAYFFLGKVRPNAIIGFGGYPTFPPLIAASLRGIPSAVHEQNAVVGRANRFMLRFVKRIATSFSKTKHITAKNSKKVNYTGNPVRQKVLDWVNLEYSTPQINDDFHLLVFGGSQGARFFSDTVPEVVAKLSEKHRKRLKIVQQCREEDVERVKEAYQKAGIEFEVDTFFDNLPELMAYSHLVIGRSGASSVTELAVLGRPSILVPLPHALDSDQLLNANSLMDEGGALCVAQKDLTTERLTQELETFMENPDKLAKAAKSAKSVGKPQAVSLLADMVEELIREGK